MVFNSWTFAGLLFVFLPLYALVRTHVRRRNLLLIVTSYVFYGWWDWRFLILVAASTSVDYVAALGAAGQRVGRGDVAKSAVLLVATAALSTAATGFADRALLPISVGGTAIFVVAAAGIRRIGDAKAARGAWLALSLVTNLGILAFFKYFNFFTANVGDVMKMVGFSADYPVLRIILPVGLSFYTFQAISRTIDSYRGVYHPKRSLVDYAAYHAFFPQLVAGPIERAGHLMPQFETVLPVTFAMVRSGALLFAWGLFQKIVVADNLAPLSDAVFDAPQGKSGAATVVGILAFSLQIYGDFGGYSNMARGVARVLGFDLMANFNLPYFARTPQEFWQRWHISLSRWLRDYLYIPLGGSREGEAATARNLMITMLLGGLWHGAAWTFVVWGAFHGAIQVVFRALGIGALLESRKPDRPAHILLHMVFWLITAILVATGWVFFRARTFGTAALVLHNSLAPTGYTPEAFHTLAGYALPLVIVEVWQRFRPALPLTLRQPPFLARYTAAVVLVMCIMLLSAEAGRQFIYFDF